MTAHSTIEQETNRNGFATGQCKANTIDTLDLIPKLETKFHIMQLIRTFSDGSTLAFDKGMFDEWCLYFQKPGQKRFAPTDIQYFKRFVALARIYGNLKIYQHFVEFYSLTTQKLDEGILKLIEKQANEYSIHRLEMEKLFTIVYAGMVAEENKAKAILKKRIKRLGMHQILIEKRLPEFAASFSRGKTWKELDRFCEERRF
jgi:hypothetical protein